MEIKEEILNLWKQVQRPGIEKLVEFLETSDFFTAPCSTQYHLANPGGLAEHSLNVYEALVDKIDYFEKLPDSGFPTIENETIIICALGHDLCKANYYGIEKKWRKDSRGHWESYDAYCVKDVFPLGHGEKSLSILQDYIPLSDVEKLAIRWHMGFFDAGIHFNYPSGYAYRAAQEAHPLVTLLCTADFEVSQIIEAGK